MNHAELISVLRKFEGAHTRDEMKSFLDESDIIESKWYFLVGYTFCFGS
jgi:hypothetical protein